MHIVLMTHPYIRWAIGDKNLHGMYIVAPYSFLFFSGDATVSRHVKEESFHYLH